MHAILSLSLSLSPWPCPYIFDDLSLWWPFGMTGSGLVVQHGINLCEYGEIYTCAYVIGIRRPAWNGGGCRLVVWMGLFYLEYFLFLSSLDPLSPGCQIIVPKSQLINRTLSLFTFPIISVRNIPKKKKLWESCVMEPNSMTWPGSFQKIRLDKAVLWVGKSVAVFMETLRRWHMNLSPALRQIPSMLR